MDALSDTMIGSSTVHQITPEILSPMAGIDEFKGAWRCLGTLAWHRVGAPRYGGWPPSRVSAHPPAAKAAGLRTVTSNVGCPGCNWSRSRLPAAMSSS